LPSLTSLHGVVFSAATLHVALSASEFHGHFSGVLVTDCQVLLQEAKRDARKGSARSGRQILIAHP
jgi:hypothetical protein